jgi:hypothetical protein
LEAGEARTPDEVDLAGGAGAVLCDVQLGVLRVGLSFLIGGVIAGAVEEEH